MRVTGLSYFNKVQKGIEIFFDFLFPPKCAACDTMILPDRESDFCSECMRDIHWIKDPLCFICGYGFATVDERRDPSGADSPAPVDSATTRSRNHLCGDCIKKTYRFDRARSATFYRGKVKETIKRFKFLKMPELARPLARITVASEVVKSALREADTLVPVPLHKARLNQRGFNQSLLLARELSRATGLKLLEHTLRRTRHTLPQVGLGKKERRRNVKGAFEVRNPGDVKDKSIVLVDDVFTTGNTLNECSRVLKKAGAGQVIAVTVSRASLTEFDI